MSSNSTQQSWWVYALGILGGVLVITGMGYLLGKANWKIVDPAVQGAIIAALASLLTLIINSLLMMWSNAERARHELRMEQERANQEAEKEQVRTAHEWRKLFWEREYSRIMEVEERAGYLVETVGSYRALPEVEELIKDYWPAFRLDSGRLRRYPDLCQAIRNLDNRIGTVMSMRRNSEHWWNGASQEMNECYKQFLEACDTVTQRSIWYQPGGGAGPSSESTPPAGAE